jgi:NhaP-type Na+/H+ and K+/H+ antiporter
MLAGAEGPGGILFRDFHAAYLIGSIGLAIILFDGGLRTDPDDFRGSGANCRHEQTILASLCDVQARSTAFQTAGAARP